MNKAYTIQQDYSNLQSGRGVAASASLSNGWPRVSSSTMCGIELTRFYSLGTRKPQQVSFYWAPNSDNKQYKYTENE